MYSEHGLDAVIRPVSGLVCQSLIVSSYCRPGSAHSHAAWRSCVNSSRASTVSMTSPVLRPRRPNDGALLDRAHELVGDADGVVGVLVLHRGDVVAAEVHVEAGVAQRADLVLLARLGLTNSSMSGWSTSRTTILAARRVAPPDLMVPADASAPRMKETGPLTPCRREDSSSLEERMRERFRPAPEPPLKMKPSSLYQFRIESIESSTDEDEARGDLLRRRGADVEPDRGVEGEVLVGQQPGQLVLEDLGVGRRWRSSRGRCRPWRRSTPRGR